MSARQNKTSDAGSRADGLTTADVGRVRGRQGTVPQPCSLCADIDPADLQAALVVAGRHGGTSSEVFVEHRASSTLRSNGSAVDARTDRDVGAAVRVTAGGITGLASTNVLTRAGLCEAAEAAAATAGRGSAQPSISLTERSVRPAHSSRPPPGDTPVADKAELVARAAHAARSVDARIRLVSVTYVDVTQHLVVANSDGVLVRDARTRTRMTCRAVARTHDHQQAGFEGPGTGGGLELFDEHPPEQVGAAAAERAIRMLTGISFTEGESMVVLGPGGGGLFLHEACGHGLEADGLSRGSSVYARSIGGRLAGSHVSAVDDPSRAGGFGSYGVDDEGRAAGPTSLIDHGVQAGALTDAGTAAHLTTPPSANARRESYAHPPLCRMSNTYLEPGPDRAQDVVADVRRGLYVARLGGGDVDPVTGDFAFTSSEAYLIENGRLTRPVAGATLLGNGPRALAAIDAVADDLSFTQAMCGKDGQWVPVSYGSPTIRIRGLLITG